jgi:hypothetical protein
MLVRIIAPCKDLHNAGAHHRTLINPYDSCDAVLSLVECYSLSPAACL